MAWSGFGQTHLVWKQAGVPESSGPVCGRTATSPPPVYHFKTRFCSSTDILSNIVQNQPGSDIVLADCVRFWPNGSGPEANRCARIIRLVSGQYFRSDPDRMRMGSGMFTGLPTVALTWHVYEHKVHKLRQRYIVKKGCLPVAYI